MKRSPTADARKQARLVGAASGKDGLAGLIATEYSGTVDADSGDEGSPGVPASAPNVFAPVWDAESQEPPYRWRRCWIGRRAGAEQLGASLFEIEAGASTFPLHVHYANEELILVLEGTIVLRSLTDEQTLRPGDVFSCPAGRSGAHRLDNRSSERARVLILSTMHAPEINEFPDSGIVWARTSAPGAPTAPEAQIAGPAETFNPLSLP